MSESNSAGRVMPRTELSDEAEAEIEEAVAYYEAIQSRLADDLLDRIEHGLNRIADLPATWPTHLRDTRRYLIKQFPYALVYRVQGGVPYVLAFAHQARKPGYWQDR